MVFVILLSTCALNCLPYNIYDMYQFAQSVASNIYCIGILEHIIYIGRIYSLYITYIFLRLSEKRRHYFYCVLPSKLLRYFECIWCIFWEGIDVFVCCWRVRS